MITRTNTENSGMTFGLSSLLRMEDRSVIPWRKKQRYSRQALLAGKGLGAAFDALEAYGTSCEDEVSLLRETDPSTFELQLKPLHENTSIGPLLL